MAKKLEKRSDVAGKLTDAEFAEVERRLNACVHELVFAMKHAEDDELDWAGDCLVTVAGVVEEVAQELANRWEGRGEV